MWSYMAAPMCTHTLVFCVVYPQQDYSPPLRKNFEDSFNVGIRISANLTDIQMKIEALLTSLSKNRRSVTGSSFRRYSLPTQL